MCSRAGAVCAITDVAKGKTDVAVNTIPVKMCEYLAMIEEGMFEYFMFLGIVGV
jgi:hypothetical protein